MNDVTRTDILEAITSYQDLGVFDNTRVIYEGKKYNAKSLRALAYYNHYQRLIDLEEVPSGIDNIIFFEERGFEVEYHSKVYEVKEEGSFKFDMSVLIDEEDPEDDPYNSTEERLKFISEEIDKQFNFKEDNLKIEIKRLVDNLSEFEISEDYYRKILLKEVRNIKEKDYYLEVLSSLNNIEVNDLVFNITSLRTSGVDSGLIKVLLLDILSNEYLDELDEAVSIYLELERIKPYEVDNHYNSLIVLKRYLVEISDVFNYISLVEQDRVVETKEEVLEMIVASLNSLYNRVK